MVPAKFRCSQPRSSVAEVQQPHGSRIQKKASTSAAQPAGELASTSGLVHPGHRQTSTAVTLGDVVSLISAVQAGAMASTSSAAQPARIQRQARRAHSALLDAFENPIWQPTTSAAPVLPPFTGQPGIQVETLDFSNLDFYQPFFTEDLYRSTVDQSNLYAAQFIAANPNLTLVREFGWKPITVPKCKTLSGPIPPHGITKKVELRSYWSTDPI